MENMKLNRTFFPNFFSQNLNAILAFTTLFDITAIRIAEVATAHTRSPSLDSVAIVCVIASTSASHDKIPSI